MRPSLDGKGHTGTLLLLGDEREGCTSVGLMLGQEGSPLPFIPRGGITGKMPCGSSSSIQPVGHQRHPAGPQRWLSGVL